MRDALRDKRHREIKPQPSTRDLQLLQDIKRRGYIQIDPHTMDFASYTDQYEEFRAFASRCNVAFLDGGNWFAVGTPEALKNLSSD